MSNILHTQKARTKEDILIQDKILQALAASKL